VKAKAAREKCNSSTFIFLRANLKFQIQARHFEAIIFSAKAAIAAVAGALCYKFLNLPGTPWVAAVSAVLVTQPDLHSSLKVSLRR
jgi:uncharacterized membrane protein YgaE (UPF0421/DUF939 family)